jgi:hypothetical protein
MNNKIHRVAVSILVLLVVTTSVTTVAVADRNGPEKTEPYGKSLSDDYQRADQILWSLNPDNAVGDTDSDPSWVNYDGLYAGPRKYNEVTVIGGNPEDNQWYLGDVIGNDGVGSSTDPTLDINPFRGYTVNLKFRTGMTGTGPSPDDTWMYDTDSSVVNFNWSSNTVMFGVETDNINDTAVSTPHDSLMYVRAKTVSVDLSNLDERNLSVHHDVDYTSSTNISRNFELRENGTTIASASFDQYIRNRPDAVSPDEWINQGDIYQSSDSEVPDYDPHISNITYHETVESDYTATFDNISNPATGIYVDWSSRGNVAHLLAGADDYDYTVSVETLEGETVTEFDLYEISEKQSSVFSTGNDEVFVPFVDDNGRYNHNVTSNYRVTIDSNATVSDNELKIEELSLTTRPNIVDEIIDSTDGLFKTFDRDTLQEFETDFGDDNKYVVDSDGGFDKVIVNSTTAYEFDLNNGFYQTFDSNTYEDTLYRTTFDLHNVNGFNVSRPAYGSDYEFKSVGSGTNTINFEVVDKTYPTYGTFTFDYGYQQWGTDTNFDQPDSADANIWLYRDHGNGYRVNFYGEDGSEGDIRELVRHNGGSSTVLATWQESENNDVDTYRFAHENTSDGATWTVKINGDKVATADEDASNVVPNDGQYTDLVGESDSYIESGVYDLIVADGPGHVFDRFVVEDTPETPEIDTNVTTEEGDDLYTNITVEDNTSVKIIVKNDTDVVRTETVPSGLTNKTVVMPDLPAGNYTVVYQGSGYTLYSYGLAQSEDDSETGSGPISDPDSPVSVVVLAVIIVVCWIVLKKYVMESEKR